MFGSAALVIAKVLTPFWKRAPAYGNENILEPVGEKKPKKLLSLHMNK